ncbi:hypothetical protein ANN_21484 [Periplaneta americana]|uniref:PiggyBac transposable element-derived protein domain-containing protein n=1 Tax=Periplaneta americana TaxID=6978 RepID=A0ABQ8SG86_PERAM|nr:hypothetical protein ANN_21484 [Periplaneta americana]
MDDDIVSNIVQHKNEEGRRNNIEETNRTEFLAFLGILISIGANNDASLDYHDLWSGELGRSAHIAGMSRIRFRDLLWIIRFDDKSTREIRRQSDKFAPLREIFQLINANFPKFYCAYKNTTIDEMLSLFRGNCRFRVFMKDKLGK